MGRWSALSQGCADFRRRWRQEGLLRTQFRWHQKQAWGQSAQLLLYPSSAFTPGNSDSPSAPRIALDLHDLGMQPSWHTTAMRNWNKQRLKAFLESWSIISSPEDRSPMEKTSSGIALTSVLVTPPNFPVFCSKLVFLERLAGKRQATNKCKLTPDSRRECLGSYTISK